MKREKLTGSSEIIWDVIQAHYKLYVPDFKPREGNEIDNQVFLDQERRNEFKEDM